VEPTVFVVAVRGRQHRRLSVVRPLAQTVNARYQNVS